MVCTVESLLQSQATVMGTVELEIGDFEFDVTRSDLFHSQHVSWHGCRYGRDDNGTLLQRSAGWILRGYDTGVSFGAPSLGRYFGCYGAFAGG